MITIIQRKNGLQANKTLNKLAEKLEKTYKSSKNLKFGFEMSRFDGLWEFKIKNTKTNKGLVLKEDPKYNNCQRAFVYLQSIDTTDTQTSQMREDLRQYVKNTDLFNFSKHCISAIAK
jgi:hypothetical protein